MRCANPKKAEAVLALALSKIKPSGSETRKDFEEANRLIKKLQASCPESVIVSLGGSLAKGTNIAGNNEFDIFLLFPRHYSHHEMTMLGVHYARKAFAGMRVESRYAEHPYIQVFSGDYHADVVPAYKIADISQKGSSVDRTQLHTAYVNSKLDSKGKDDVRLLKRFMKNFGIYGAELRVEGFSGYLCEILIIKYGSLMSLFEHASSWEAPSLVLEGDEGGQAARKRFNSPLVVIDPVDTGRNVAAVVSQTSLSRFIFECRRFLASPSKEFFHKEARATSVAQIKAAIKARGTECLLLAFPAPPTVPDVVWPQLKKTAQALVRHLQSLDFSVFGHYYWSDGKECTILLEVDRWELPAVRKAAGPAIRFSKDVDAFVGKHSRALNLHIEHDRMVAVEKREVRDCAVALKSACRKPRAVGVPEGMCAGILKYRLLEGKAVAKPKYAWFLGDYFFAKIA
ncbi:MAG: CCA tRNA nucleotidyltransferase [Candidatus Micrarchaeia archaeon]